METKVWAGLPGVVPEPSGVKEVSLGNPQGHGNVPRVSVPGVTGGGLADMELTACQN